MANGILADQQYSEVCQLLSRDGWKEVTLRFDEAQREFETSWKKIFVEFKNKPDESADASQKLIDLQPSAIALSFAMARCDEGRIFHRFKRFIEFILKSTERLSGYPAIAGVPHAQAGFLYMATSVMAFHWEAWDIFEKLLNAKFEWYYQSGRPMFHHAFDLPYFFHSESLNREASRSHDFFRKELVEPWITSVTQLNGDYLRDSYAQTQMLMCLKVAQLRERGETASIWPDFGRFYAQRVATVLDRAYEDHAYGSGLLRGFGEDPNTFFARLNSRLELIRSIFWSGSQYFWESLRSWEPRRTHV